MRKVLILAIALAFVATALPAMAAERTVTMYGDARMGTFIWKDSRETNARGASASWTPSSAYATTAFPGRAASALYDDTDTEWGIDYVLSRWGMRVTDGDVSGNVELRPWSASYFRHWYGAWNFGVGSLVVGQTWTPDSNDGITETLVGGGQGGSFGDLGGGGRAPQLALWFPIKDVGGTLKIAFVQPYVSPYGDQSGLAGDIDTSTPKINACMDFLFGPVKWFVTAGYNTIDVVNATNKEYGVDSYYLGTSLIGTVGPVTLKGDIWWGQNIYEYGLQNGTGIGFVATYDAVSDSIMDTKYFAWGLSANYKFTDAVQIQVAYVTLEGTRDWSAGREDTDDQAYYYARLPITLAKNVMVVPEIGKLDYKDRLVNNVRTTEGDTVYYGAYWQISF